mgnify:CR=1 FL=1
MTLFRTGFGFFLCLFLFSKFINAQSTYITSFKTDAYGGLSSSITVGSKIYFTAVDDSHGRELWCSDGTVIGTYMISDIFPGIGSGLGDFFTLTSHNMNGIVYFRGNDGQHGVELWRSDGTAAGTYMVKDIEPGAGNSSVGEFAHINNTLYFTNGSGTSLWRSDGTANGTFSFYSFSVATNLTAFNGILYFSADDANNGQELWRSNGTTNGTYLLKDLNGTFGASLPCNFHATPSILFFMASTTDGWELWKTTGTNASTELVKDINPGGNNGVMSSYSDVSVASLGDTLYFRADDGITGFQLWRSDGTNGGTLRVSNVSNGVDSYCSFPVVNGKVLFNNYLTPRFYQYDPVSDTTTLSEYPSYYSFNLYPDKFKFSNDLMIYADKDTLYGCEVWRADGTPSGIKRIQETHLVDNWNTSTVQGFNSITGIAGNNVLFTKARRFYDTDIPLFSFDVTNSNYCYPPAVSVAVPVSDTTAQIVWNRIENTTLYEIRYQQTGTGMWNTLTTNKSYCALNNLIPSNDYDYQLRSYCDGSWTNWSATSTFNSSFSFSDYIVHILAERCENDSTIRIYWMPSTQIQNLQIRYRPFGTSNWTVVSNTNGFKRISGLLPNTLYAYQYRANYGGTWDQWSSFEFYFVTLNDVTTGIEDSEISSNEIAIYPNPTMDHLSFPSIEFDSFEYFIFDENSKLVQSGFAKNKSIEISSLANGIYFVKINQRVLKFIKI